MRDRYFRNPIGKSRKRGFEILENRILLTVNVLTQTFEESVPSTVYSAASLVSDFSDAESEYLCEFDDDLSFSESTPTESPVTTGEQATDTLFEQMVTVPSDASTVLPPDGDEAILLTEDASNPARPLGMIESTELAQEHLWNICFTPEIQTQCQSNTSLMAAYVDAMDGVRFEWFQDLGDGWAQIRSVGGTLESIRTTLCADTDLTAVEQDVVLTASMTDGGTTEVSTLDDSTTASSGSSAEESTDGEVAVAATGSSAPDPSAFWNLGDTGVGTGAFTAQMLGSNPQTVVVGVLDTGIDFSHGYLESFAWTNPGELAGDGIDNDGNGYVDDVCGWDFANNDSNPTDDHRHGTHVAGIVALGSPNVQLVSLKFLSSDGTGLVSNAVKAIRYAIQLKESGVNLRVITCSWASAVDSSALHDAIEDAGNAGILIVTAAGNAGKDIDDTGVYPASDTASNILTVGAVTDQGDLASYSNYGVNSVDVAAPGSGIYSTGLNSTWFIYSGTSMAVPHVASVAALAWSFRPDATVQQVRQAIIHGVTTTETLAGVVASGGHVNAVRTLELLGVEQYAAPEAGSITTNAATVNSDDAFTVTVKDVIVPGGGNATVKVYADTNMNGQLDSGDSLLGTANVIGSQATLSVTLSGNRTFLLFGQVTNSVGVESVAVRTSITVHSDEKMGNKNGPLLRVTPGRTVYSTVARGGTSTWRMTLEAGKTYTLETILGTLRDSKIELYTADGTLLVRNDDKSLSNKASKIVWTSNYSGEALIKVTSPDGVMSGTYWMKIHASSPSLAVSGGETSENETTSGNTTTDDTNTDNTVNTTGPESNTSKSFVSTPSSAWSKATSDLYPCLPASVLQSETDLSAWLNVLRHGSSIRVFSSDTTLLSSVASVSPAEIESQTASFLTLATDTATTRKTRMSEEGELPLRHQLIDEVWGQF